MDYELSGNGHESSERTPGYTSFETFKPPGAYKKEGFTANEDIDLFQTPVAKKKNNQNIVAVKDLYELESMKVDRDMKAKKKMQCCAFFIVLISVVLFGASFGAGFFVGSLDEDEVEVNITDNPTDSPTNSPTKNPTNRPTKNPTRNPTTSPTEDDAFFAIDFAETLDTFDICLFSGLVTPETVFDGCLDQLGFYSCRFNAGENRFDFARQSCPPGTLCKCGDNVLLTGDNNPCVNETVDEVAFCSTLLLPELPILGNAIPLNEDEFFGQANERCADDNQFEACISPAMKATCFEGKVDFQRCNNNACTCSLNEFIENDFDLCDLDTPDEQKCVST